MATSSTRVWATTTVEQCAHLGTRARLGELPEHLDPLRLEQGVDLLKTLHVVATIWSISLALPVRDGRTDRQPGPT